MTTSRRVLGPLIPGALLLGLGAQQWSAGHPNRAGASAALAVGAAIVAALVVLPRTRWLVPAVVPLLIAGVLGVVSSHPLRAGVLAGIGLLAVALLAVGVDVNRWAETGTGALARALTIGAGAVVFAIVILPGWAWSGIRRRDGLGRSKTSGPAWTDVERRPASAGTLGIANPASTSGRSLTGRLTWAVGCVVVLLAANFGAGWAWDSATGRRGPDSVATAVSPSTGGVRRDPRIDEPAMAAYPWRARYFADIQRTAGGYWPYTESRPSNFRSPYVNQDGWTRRTYQSRGGAASRPAIWMFGGSTTWGEGQRDGYTIASWISRLAAQDRVPVGMRNYGQRGWTHFQEMILYEQQLAQGPDPDFSVFYDGANEINTQSLLSEAVPSHTLAYTYAQRLGSGSIETSFVQQPEPANVAGDVWHAYSQHSAIHKLVHLLRTSAASASPAQRDQTQPGQGFTPGQEQDPENGGVYSYDATNQDGTDAGKVYERGKQLTLSLSQRYRVRPWLFWQPVRGKGQPQRNAIAQLTASTVDLSDILAGHDDVYIDGGHTNEQGARLVAVEIWKRIEPAVRRWYATH